MQYTLITTLLTAASLISALPTPADSPLKQNNNTFTINVFNQTSPSGYLVPNPAPISRSTPLTIILDQLITFPDNISGDLVMDVCSNYNVDFTLMRCKVLGRANVDPNGPGTFFNATTVAAFAGTKPMIKGVICTKVQGQWDNRVDQFNSYEIKQSGATIPLSKEQLLCSKGPIDEFLHVDLFQ